MRWPGVIVPNTAPLGLASLLDVPATLLAAAGCVPSADGAGFDLVAVARGTRVAAAPADATIAGVRWGQNHTRHPRRTAVAVTDFFGYGVVTAQWKMMYYPRENEGRLFHRHSDPHDRANRWRNPSESDDDDDERVTTAMLAALLRWRARQEPIGYFRSALAESLATAARVSKTGSGQATQSHKKKLKSMVATVRGTDAEIGLMEDLEGL